MNTTLNINCLFCKIVTEEVPSYIIYNDTNTIAFLDINPATRGHTLVIAKTHSNDFITSSDEIITSVAITAKKVANHLKEKLNPCGFNFLSNTGIIAGQTVMHYHCHIIPKYEINHGLILTTHSESNNDEFEKLQTSLMITY